MHRMWEVWGWWKDVFPVCMFLNGRWVSLAVCVPGQGNERVTGFEKRRRNEKLGRKRRKANVLGKQISTVWIGWASNWDLGIWIWSENGNFFQQQSAELILIVEISQQFSKAATGWNHACIPLGQWLYSLGCSKLLLPWYTYNTIRMHSYNLIFQELHLFNHHVSNGCLFSLQSKLQGQFSSVQLCPTLCDPMNHGTPGLPVHHQIPEFTQTHVHQVGDAIQPSHPLSSPSPPAPNPSQHQGLFQWVNSSHEVAKVLEFQLQHQSFQWTPRTDLL